MYYYVTGSFTEPTQTWGTEVINGSLYSASNTSVGVLGFDTWIYDSQGVNGSFIGSFQLGSDSQWAYDCEGLTRSGNMLIGLVTENYFGTTGSPFLIHFSGTGSPWYPPASGTVLPWNGSTMLPYISNAGGLAHYNGSTMVMGNSSTGSLYLWILSGITTQSDATHWDRYLGSIDMGRGTVQSWGLDVYNGNLIFAGNNTLIYICNGIGSDLIGSFTAPVLSSQSLFNHENNIWVVDGGTTSTAFKYQSGLEDRNQIYSKYGNLLRRNSSVTSRLEIMDGQSNNLLGDISLAVGFNGLTLDGSGNVITSYQIISPYKVVFYSGISNIMTGSWDATPRRYNGLTVANGNLIGTNTANSYIYVHDGLTSSVIGSTLGQSSMRGLSYYGGSLFFGKNSNFLFVCSGTTTSNMVTTGSYAIPGNANGITTDLEGNLLVATSDGYLCKFNGTGSTITGSILFTNATSSDITIMDYLFPELDKFRICYNLKNNQIDISKIFNKKISHNLDSNILDSDQIMSNNIYAPPANHIGKILIDDKKDVKFVIDDRTIGTNNER